MNNLDPALTHDRLADQFDEVMNEYDINRRLEVLIDCFLGDIDLQNKLVLDAGCGTGRGTQRLSELGAKVVAFDYGLNLLRYTTERYPCQPVGGSIIQLPFPDGTFDVVFSSEVIEHTPDPLKGVEEMVRVLKPGGRLVLSTPNKLWQLPVEIASWMRLRPYDGLENFVWPRDLRSTLEASQGRIIQHKGIHFIPFQIKLLQPVSRFLDDWGEILLPFMINQCISYEN